MSRWTSAFDTHEYQQIWSELGAELEKIKGQNQADVANLQEVARFKRLQKYLDDLVRALDKDLTPTSVLDGAAPQARAALDNVRRFVSDNNIAWMQQANAHGDALLMILRPYYADGIRVVGAKRQAMDAYATEIQSFLDGFKQRASDGLAVIVAQGDDSATLLTNTRKENQRVKAFAGTLLDDTDESQSIRSKIEATKVDTDIRADAIRQLFDELLSGENSTKVQVNAAAVEALAGRNRILEVQENVQERIRSLDAFHTKIFGDIDLETGKPKGGLAFELDQRQAQLTKFEGEQKTKHDTLYNKIDGLLPGAASAGLASAYNKIKGTFETPIKNYTILFCVALGAIGVGALLTIIDSFTLWPFSINFVKTGGLEGVLTSLLYKLPLIGPAVWLTVFASNRRSQYERLQQEYAHKEALASSYDSYKRQLEELKDESEELKRALIVKAIDAVGYNPSITLEGKHGDKHPLQEVFEKFSKEDVKTLIETIKSFKPK